TVRHGCLGICWRFAARRHCHPSGTVDTSLLRKCSRRKPKPPRLRAAAILQGQLAALQTRPVASARELVGRFLLPLIGNEHGPTASKRLERVARPTGATGMQVQLRTTTVY